MAYPCARHQRRLVAQVPKWLLRSAIAQREVGKHLRKIHDWY
jgi:hypothetical protein